MTPLTYSNQTKQQVCLHRNWAHRIKGGYRGASAAFIHVLDKVAFPVNGDVPIKSYPVAAGSDAAPTPWGEDFIAASLVIQNGLWIAVSTTDATFTADTSLKTDITVELEVADGTVTGIGDLVNNTRNSLLVLSEPVGATQAVRLRKVDFISGSAGNSKCVMVFAQNTPPDGTRPVARLFCNPDGSALASSTQFSADFSERGTFIYSQEVSGGALVTHQGITLVVSNTTDVLTANTDSESCLHAEYVS